MVTYRVKAVIPRSNFLPARCTYLCSAGGLVCSSSAFALPMTGVVSAGGATIVSSPGVLTIDQSSQNAAINCKVSASERARAYCSFSPIAIGSLNRVLGPMAQAY